MFGDDWSNSSGDMNYLICHLTQQNHVIEGSSNFVKESFPWYVTALPNLVAIGIVVAEITFFFFSLGFLSRTFTIHRTEGEEGSYLFNHLLDSSSLHVASSWH